MPPLSMLITGISDVEMTTFLFYLTCKLVRLDKAVVLETCSSVYWYPTRCSPASVIVMVL